MGMSAYAYAPDQAALKRDLEAQGLSENLRMCGMEAWKYTFEECTGQDICDLDWSTVPARVVAHWADAACLKSTLTEDETKMYTYFSICKKHGASIEFG
eukprot:364273-Chlamydomonas_euryale.AAC.8